MSMHKVFRLVIFIFIFITLAQKEITLAHPHAGETIPHVRPRGSAPHNSKYPKGGVLENPLPDPNTPAPSIYAASSSSPDNSFNAEDDAKALAGDLNKGLIENFMTRSTKQRQEIISAYNKLNPNSPFYPKDYKFLTGDDMTELKFALSLEIPTDLILEYLHSCFEEKPSYWWGPYIVEILGLADMDKKKFLDQYKEKFGDDVDHGIHKQGKDYKNFLKEIVKRERAPDSTAFNDDDVRKWARKLSRECSDWGNKRKHLDEFTSNKSKKFIRAVVPTYKSWYGESLYETIDHKISDHNLKIGYKYLGWYDERNPKIRGKNINYSCIAVLFAVNYHEAIATRIYESFDEPFSQIPTKITNIVSFSESTLGDINTAFQNKYKQTIKQYLLSKSMDPVNQALAAMSEQVGSNSAQLTLSTTPPPPAVAPTTMANP